MASDDWRRAASKVGPADRSTTIGSQAPFPANGQRNSAGRTVAGKQARDQTSEPVIGIGQLAECARDRCRRDA